MDILKRTIPFLAILFLSLCSYAGDAEVRTYLRKSEIIINKDLYVEDLLYAEDNSNPNFTVTRQAKLLLEYHRSNQTDLLTSSGNYNYWRYEVDYIETTSSQTGTLVLMYNGENNPGTYADLNLLSSGVSNSAILITDVRAWYQSTPLDVNNLGTPTVTSPDSDTRIPGDIQLSLIIETERYYNFSLSDPITLYQNGVDPTLGIDIGWSYLLGAEKYDFEWVFIDGYDASAPTVITEVFNYKEGTRVTTPDQTYRIDPMFPYGILYYRVRGRGQDKVSDWNYCTAGILLNGFELNKNWQYVISFAEDGKHKSALNYMDGSLRGKQSITHLSTDDVFVVGVNRYDHEGRESVSILPAPVDQYSADHNYSYKEKVNIANDGLGTTMFNKDFFDVNIGDNSTGDKQITNSNGAGEYYSANNSFTTALNRDYIADAGGFPYSQTEYTRDGTGRPFRSSGVGPDHRLGSGHETFYVYSTPNTVELRQLFGSNVGNVSHYKKNYVLDANGQVSAAYLDQEGRTIATCLVGNSPNSLMDLGATSDTRTINLNDNNGIDYDENGDVVSGNISMVTSVIPTQTFNFTYELNQGVIASLINGTNTYCENCSYTLEIRVIKPDGSLYDLAYTDPDNPTQTLQYVKHYFSNPNAASCSTNYYTGGSVTFSFTSSTFFPENYTIVKTLRANPIAVDAAYTTFVNTSTGFFPDLTALQNSNQGLIDNTNCNIYDDKISPTSAISGGYADQNTNLCETYLEGMKADVSPGGWLFESKWLDDLCPITIGTTTYNNRADFTSLWSSVLADDLVVYHREYCHYTKCVETQDITTYTNTMAVKPDYATATTAIPDTNYTLAGWGTGTNNDPIFKPRATISSVQQSALLNKIVHATYFTIDQLTYQTLVEFVDPAVTVNNNSNSSAPFYPSYTGPSSYTQAMDEERWQLFFAMYNGERQKVIETAYGCTYYSDDYSYFRDPSTGLSSTQTLGQGYLQSQQACTQTCAVNVDEWLLSITNACSSLSSTDITNITGYLQSYCANTCNGANPYAFLIDNDVTTDPDLIAIKNILDANASCLDANGTAGTNNGQTVLLDIAQPDPCTTTSTQTTSIDLPVLTDAATHWGDFINELIGLLNSQTISIGVYNDISLYFSSTMQTWITANTSISSVMVDQYNKIYFKNQSGVDIGTNVQFMCMLDANDVLIPLSNATAVSNLEPSISYTDGSDYTLTFTTTWNNGGNTESTDVHFYGGCPNYYPLTTDLGFSKVFDGATSISTTPQSVTITSCSAWAPQPNYSVTVTATDIVNNCNTALSDMANATAQMQYDDQYTAVTNEFYAQMELQCFASPLAENFYYTTDVKEYQYTLYYYDQAGNLVQTVPPEGVHPLLYSSGNFDLVNGTWLGTEPVHTMQTRYHYNSLGELIDQHTPDAGDSRFFYNDNKQLRFSQNAQQAADGVFSYIKYDDIGRAIESGVVQMSVDPIQSELNDNTFPSTNLSEVTSTYYDATIIHDLPTTFDLSNSRGRIVSVFYSDVNPATINSYDHATHYSYDEHGNVKELIQDNQKIRFSNQKRKQMRYVYDLITGNVKEFVYQEGALDEYHHRYEYDADNRLTKAFTSKEGELWDQDAKYYYYLHGPVGRVEIGQDKVASSDYAYTINGWLKGVNSTTVKSTRDIGQDGNNISTNINRYNAADAYGFSLGYYNNDYASIGTTSFLATNTTAISPITYDLYNGNISHMTTGMMDVSENLINITGNAYRYDQLQRIRSMDVYTAANLDLNNSWTGAAQNNVDGYGNGDYHTEYTYDKNGNIQSLVRNSNGTPHFMDQLTYHYGTGENLNKLDYVTDPTGNSGNNDIMGAQLSGNYTYNAIGQLIGDVEEGIASIEWTAAGKVKKITRSSSTSSKQVEFIYDALGNRVGKIDKPTTNGVPQGEANWTYTHYVLDASGNQIAAYEEYYSILPNSEWETHFNLKDMNVYGASRLGSHQINTDVYTAVIRDINYGTYGYFGYSIGGADVDLDPLVISEGTITANDMGHNKRIVGNKRYELSNHLNNVLVTVSDFKLGIENPTTHVLDHYNPNVMSYSDYYPFGMLMPGRQSSSESYRYGFQGQERDDEIKGNGNSLNYRYRMHDPRLGRFFAVDPLTYEYPHNSPYAFSENVVISAIELEGLEKNDVITKSGETATVFGPFQDQKAAQTYYDGLDNPSTVKKYEMQFYKSWSLIGEPILAATENNLKETGTEVVNDGMGQNRLEFNVMYQTGSPMRVYNESVTITGNNDEATFVAMGRLSYFIAAQNSKTPWDEQNMRNWNSLLDGFFTIGAGRIGYVRSTTAKLTVAEENMVFNAAEKEAIKKATGYSRSRIVDGVGIIDRFGMYHQITPREINLIREAFIKNGATQIKIITNATNPAMTKLLNSRMNSGRGIYGLSISKRKIMPGYIIEGKL